MGIFDIFKKKTPQSKCGCGDKCKEKSQQKVEDKKTSSAFTVKVYGNCCKKSATAFKNAKEVVEELGLNWNVEQVEDLVETSSAGILQTPGLAVNGTILSQGKALSKDKIKKIFEDLAK